MMTNIASFIGITLFIRPLMDWRRDDPEPLKNEGEVDITEKFKEDEHSNGLEKEN